MTDERDRTLAGWLAVHRDLAYLVAHDYRNPIAAVFANLNFLELSVPPDQTDALEALADLRIAAEQILHLVETQVTIAQLEALGGTPLAESIPFVLDEAVQAAVDRGAPVCKAAGLTAQTVLDAPGVHIKGSRAVFEQMVEALVANGAQHVPSGRGLTVRTETRGAEAVVTYEDEGIPFGSPARDFSREGQLEMKTQNSARYSRGLGLYLVGLAVRAHGGTLETATQRGHAAVRIRLPTAALE